MNAAPSRAVVAQPAGGALALDQTEMISVLRNSFYPGATDASIKMVIAHCTAAGLDPMLKPVHIVPMSVKKPGTAKDYEWRDVVMPGIGLYRIQATRSGVYLGKTEPEFGPDVTRKLGSKEVTYPQWCRVTVRKQVGSMVAEFTAREFWMENYATAGKDTEAPNAMWTKRPYGQLAKVAEAQALRQAFPELLGGTHTAEEMEGKALDEGREMIDVTPPQKPAAAKAALDAFAGKPKEAAPAAPGPFDEAPAEPRGDATGEVPEMPMDAAEAFYDGGKWMAGWKWLSMQVAQVDAEVAQVLCEEHHALLRAVAGYNDKYRDAVDQLLSRAGVQIDLTKEAA